MSPQLFESIMLRCNNIHYKIEWEVDVFCRTFLMRHVLECVTSWAEWRTLYLRGPRY